MSSRSMRLLAWCVLLALSSGLAGAEDVCDDGGPDAFFPTIEKVVYDPSSRAPLAFRHYNAEEEVCVKEDCRAMKDWLRFSVAFWHTIRGDGSDPFGSPTKSWPWEEGEMSAMARAKVRLRAIFEFLDKLGVEYWCFHDRDIAPEGQTLQETKANLDAIVEQAKELQEKHDKKLLWGTAQLFHHKRYINGAATSPDSRVYAYAAAMVAMAMDATKKLQGQNFVFWGGREGYQSLLNSDIKQELDQLGAFMSAAADYKEEIGFDGELLIEPKPQEPMKHQYDFDVATTANFLRMNNLEGKFKINVECNHATLSGHSCEHELRTASIQGLLGNVDINTGDPQTGWDTDQFLTDPVEATRLMLTILEQGGLGKGGLNFDAKLRRESVDVEDLFYAHISGMDAMARGLKQAAAIINDGSLKAFVDSRYRSFETFDFRQDFKSLSALAMASDVPASTESGSQEKAEILFSMFT